MANLQTTLASYGLMDANVPIEQQLQDRLTNSFEPAYIKNYVTGFFSAAGNVGVTIGAVLFISFFFLQEQGLFVNFLSSLMPQHTQLSDVQLDSLVRFVRGLAPSGPSGSAIGARASC